MLIKISKIFYVLLLIYVGWFQVVILQIPHMLLFFGLGIMISIILHSFQTGTDMIKILSTELFLWILFALTSLFFGMFIAVNYGYMIDSIMTFAQFLVLIYCILYISNQDESIDFFINMFILLAIISAFTAIFWGVDYGGGRMSMGLSNNPNTLGITATIGVCCILYKLSLKKLIIVVFSFSVIFLLLHTIILTGSRKSILSFILIIIYWFVFVIFEEFKLLKMGAKVSGLLLIILVLVFGYYFFYPLLKDSTIMNRLVVLLEEGSGTRIEMYRVAFDLFKNNPLIGIGFNNYRAVTIFRTYSHSTYAEVLACTGLIGSIFYFVPYLIIISNYTKLVNSKKHDTLGLKQTKVMLGIFLILLFLGTGVIHFYSTVSSITFGMLIAFYKVNNKQSSQVIGITP